MGKLTRMNVELRDKLIDLGRPGTLSGLMNLFEANYRQLLQLIPDLDFKPGQQLPFKQAVSKSGTDFDLHLRVLQHTRYTATLHLTYWLDNGQTADPDLTVRIYNDAALAETVDGVRSRCAALRNIDPEQGGWNQRQYARNLMLSKWLEYLLENGHGFAMAARPRR